MAVASQVISPTLVSAETNLSKAFDSGIQTLESQPTINNPMELDPDDPNPYLFTMANDSSSDASPLGGSLKTETTSTGLRITELVIGNGETALEGKNVSVNYKGTLENGKEFDSSYGRAPFTFPLGAGRVIKGWDEGVAGMKVGGKRELTIPPSLGYGERGAGGVIPPNATLIFEVELLSVQ